VASVNVVSADYSIVIEKGADFQLAFRLRNSAGLMDLTGWLFASQVRATPGGSVVATLDTTVEGNTFTIGLDHTETATLTAGRYLWDLFGSMPDGRRLRLLEGQCTIVDRITQY
jgi:hypothetical protein